LKHGICPATTPAMKTRLLDDAAQYDELAAKADGIGGATDF
jgi:hypothetical protein